MNVYLPQTYLESQHYILYHHHILLSTRGPGFLLYIVGRIPNTLARELRAIPLYTSEKTSHLAHLNTK